MFIVGYRIGSPGFRIGYRVFRSDHLIFGSGPLKFLKNPDPYPIRKPEFFSGYPIRNIRNLKIGSDIRNFGSDRIFLHTPNGTRESIEFVKGVSEFCTTALEYQTSSGAVDFYCPCVDCRNVSKVSSITIIPNHCL